MVAPDDPQNDQIEGSSLMSIKVTRQQVAAARIVRALDLAEGRTSDTWVLRLINAQEPARPPKPRSTDAQGDVR